MKPETFITQIRVDVVDQSMAAYREILQSAPARPVSDTYWKRAKSLYAVLAPEQKEVLFEIMRQVSVDTLSSVFGILDGSAALGGAAANFELISNEDRVKLNGGLQDRLLEIEEPGK